MVNNCNILLSNILITFILFAVFDQIYKKNIPKLKNKYKYFKYRCK